MKQEVKEKCQYKHRCVIDLDIRIRDKIYLNIDFYCDHESCPSWMFIEKHMLWLDSRTIQQMHNSKQQQATSKLSVLSMVGSLQTL